MKDLTISLIQAPLSWEDPRANRHYFSTKLEQLDAPTDLVILPEMFTTGFTMRPEAGAETMAGASATWMLDWARRLDAAICGSLIIREGEEFRNRFLFARPDGSLEHYDKRHPFTLSGEDRVYGAGRERTVINYRGWRIRPIICYDLRFPVWARNENAYDLLVCVANWPETRAWHWRALLRARAIENQAYVAGVNRIGTDGNGLVYSGDSLVVAPHQETPLLDAQREESCQTVKLVAATLTEHRKRLPFLRDRDGFSLA